jgi:hypothetical protein
VIEMFDIYKAAHTLLAFEFTLLLWATGLVTIVFLSAAFSDYNMFTQAISGAINQVGWVIFVVAVLAQIGGPFFVGWYFLSSKERSLCAGMAGLMILLFYLVTSISMIL